jgi:hypothetical protein
VGFLFYALYLFSFTQNIREQKENKKQNGLKVIRISCNTAEKSSLGSAQILTKFEGYSET